jgi:hypothetical protein
MVVHRAVRMRRKILLTRRTKKAKKPLQKAGTVWSAGAHQPVPPKKSPATMAGRARERPFSVRARMLAKTRVRVPARARGQSLVGRRVEPRRKKPLGRKRIRRTTRQTLRRGTQHHPKARKKDRR